VTHDPHANCQCCRHSRTVEAQHQARTDTTAGVAPVLPGPPEPPMTVSQSVVEQLMEAAFGEEEP
jgi:hypothetical protein